MTWSSQFAASTFVHQRKHAGLKLKKNSKWKWRGLVAYIMQRLVG